MYVIGEFTSDKVMKGYLMQGNGQPLTFDDKTVCEKSVALLNDIDYVNSYRVLEHE